MNVRLIWKKKYIFSRAFSRKPKFKYFFLLFKPYGRFRKKYLRFKNSKFFRLLESNRFFLSCNLKINNYYDLFFWARFLSSTRFNLASLIIRRKNSFSNKFFFNNATLKYNKPIPFLLPLKRTFNKITRTVSFARKRKRFFLLNKLKKSRCHFLAVEYSIFYFFCLFLFRSFVFSHLSNSNFYINKVQAYQDFFIFLKSRFI